MSIANSVLAGALLAPLVTILSGINLSAIQRSFEWISVIAKTPQKGTLRQMKPFFKTVDSALERLFAANKFTVNTTNILLMAIVIVLIALLLENSQKPPKRVVVVENKKKTT